MIKRSEGDSEILERILTETEFKTYIEAYKLYKATENEEQKNMLLRRLGDVLSMARYMDISSPIDSQYNHEILDDRIRNLQIAVNNILLTGEEERTLNYYADQTNTPLILRSLEFLDNQKYPEIGSLIEKVARRTGNEQTLIDELKRIVGNSYQILFTRKDNKVIIYDIDSLFKPSISKDQYEAIKKVCLEELSRKTDSIIQKTYDEMVYQTVYFNLLSEVRGFDQGKKRKKD